MSVIKSFQLVRGEQITKAPKIKAGRRTIDLTPSTAVVLREYRAKQDETRALLGLPRTTPQDVIFSDPDGVRFLPNRVTNAWERIVKQTGFTGIRLHDARHSHTTMMLANGEYIKTVQERLGHSTPMVTLNIYGGSVTGLQKAAAVRFDERAAKAELATNLATETVVH